MYKYKAGTDIKAGQVVYLGKDGKAYPLSPKRPAQRDWPIGIALTDSGADETLDIQVKGSL